MKKILCLSLALAALSLPIRAETAVDDKTIIDQQKKTYPLTQCVVSGEKLETTPMGAPIDYVYTQKNADGTESKRLVRFCCKDCVKKFNQAPDKYLKSLDAAAKKGA